MTKKIFLKYLLFSLMFLQGMYYLTLLFSPKGDTTSQVPFVNSLISPYLLSEKQDGFYNERKNSLDVVFIGSSNIHCDINPNVIWDRYGITSYNFSSEQQDLGTTYYYLKQVFETQSPKAVVIDVYLSGSEESIDPVQAHFAFDHMKNDRNKAEGILNRAGKDFLELFIPMIRYHERWKSLEKLDFLYRPGQHNLLKGAVIYMSENPAERPVLPDPIPVGTLSERTVRWLDSIRQLCREHGCECIFIKTPLMFYSDLFSYFAAVESYCETNGVPFLFMNKMIDEIGIDYGHDFADDLHLNWQGQQKLSLFLGSYLQQSFGIENKKGLPEYAQWDKDRDEMMYYIENFRDLYAEAHR